MIYKHIYVNVRISIVCVVVPCIIYTFINRKHSGWFRDFLTITFSTTPLGPGFQ